VGSGRQFGGATGLATACLVAASGRWPFFFYQLISMRQACMLQSTFFRKSPASQLGRLVNGTPLTM
jgi:hypothetical protein